MSEVSRRSGRHLKPNALYAAEEFELSSGVSGGDAAASSVARATDPATLWVCDAGAEAAADDANRAERRRQTRCKGLLARLQPVAAAAAATQQAAALGELGKKRRKKAPSAETKAATVARRLHDVERNADGTPRMPIVLFKGLVVHSLGTVVTDRRKFHAKKCFFLRTPSHHSISHSLQPRVSSPFSFLFHACR